MTITTLNVMLIPAITTAIMKTIVIIMLMIILAISVIIEIITTATTTMMITISEAAWPINHRERNGREEKVKHTVTLG